MSSPFADYHYQSNLTETYDLLVRQTVPYLIRAAFEDPDTHLRTVLTRSVCVVPNKTVAGSRAVPGGKAPWEDEESKGVGMAAGWFAVVFAGAAGAVLMI